MRQRQELAAFDHGKRQQPSQSLGDPFGRARPRSEREETGAAASFLQRRGHLGQAGVPGDQRQRPGRRSFRRHHPKGLGEHRRDHEHVEGRQRGRRVPMIQAAREHDTLPDPGGRLDLVAAQIQRCPRSFAEPRPSVPSATGARRPCSRTRPCGGRGRNSGTPSRRRAFVSRRR